MDNYSHNINKLKTDNSVDYEELKDYNELEDKLKRIKIMSDGDIIDFIKFKNNNQLYVIIGIVSIIFSLIPLIIRKVNRIYSTNILLGGADDKIIENKSFEDKANEIGKNLETKFANKTDVDIDDKFDFKYETEKITTYDINWMTLIYNILIILITLFLIIGALSLKKISLYCFGCSKGSWWYKCSTGTGYGSDICNDYKNAHEIFRGLVNRVYKTIDKAMEATDLIKDAINEIEKNIKNFTNNIITELTIPDFEIPKISNYPDITLNFTVPIININIDIGVPLRLAIHGILDQINNSLQFTKIITDTIKQGLTILIEFIANILGEILTNIAQVFNGIIDPINLSIKTIKLLKIEISKLFDIVSNIGIVNLVLYNILIFVNKIVSVIIFDNLPDDFRVGSLPNVKLGLFLSISIMLFIIFIIFPIIGGLYLGLRAYSKLILFKFKIKARVKYEKVKKKVERKIEKVNEKIEEVKSEVNENIEKVNEKIEEVKSEVNENIDKVKIEVNENIDKITDNIDTNIDKINKGGNNKNYFNYKYINKYNNRF